MCFFQESEKEKEKVRQEFEKYVVEYRTNESKVWHVTNMTSWIKVAVQVILQLMGKWKASESKHKETISQLYRDLEESRANAAAREHDLQIQLNQLRSHLHDNS